MRVIKLSSSFLFFLVVILLILSFKSRKTLQSLPEKEVMDSILKSYNIGGNRNFITSKRLEQINISYTLSRQNNIDSLALKALAVKTSIYGQAKAYDSAIFFTKKLLKYATNLKDTIFIARSFNKFGLYYLRVNQPIRAFKNFNEAKKNYLSLQDSTQVGKMALNQALIQKNLGDYLGSEETAITALKYLKPVKDKKFIASAYNVLAVNSKNQNNFKEAIYWYNKAIKETESPSDVVIYKSNLALTYLSLKKYNKAIALLTKLSENYLKKHKKEDPSINDSLIYAKWLADNEYNPTEGLMQNLNIHLNENNIYSSIESYMLLAKYNRNKNFNETINYTIKALESSKKINNVDGELKALRLLIDLKPKKEYSKYVTDYLKINDSVNNAILKAKNQFAKIKYDTDKTRDVNLVLNAKIAEDSLRIAKETYRRNLWILISAVLVIIVFFIIHNWRQRIKIASFNATTKTENRISKKVHDEMANDISSIRALVKNKIPVTNPLKKELLTKLNTTYINARDIASETGGVIFSDSFNEDLKNLVMQYSSDDTKIILSISALGSLKISQQKKNAIYRVLQELMVNMNKHSQASMVIIAHKKEGKYNEIKYSDNGIGTNLIHKNNGLDNAVSRMKDVRGSFSFETSKGNGFKAILKFKA